MKKSQVVMEFLMTYGWVILVVLIMIATLAYFGGLNPENFLPEKPEFECKLEWGTIEKYSYRCDILKEAVTLDIPLIVEKQRAWEMCRYSDTLELINKTLTITFRNIEQDMRIIYRDKCLATLSKLKFNIGGE